MTYFVGVDNGVTGSIARVGGTHPPWLLATPVREGLDYTKVAATIHRIDYPKLRNLLRGEILLAQVAGATLKAVLERPLKNPKLFQATWSAARAFEATLLALEELLIAYEIVDSRQWQSVMLPSGIKGAKDLKRASLQRGIEMFPALRPAIEEQGDADSLLMAVWLQRRGSG